MSDLKVKLVLEAIDRLTSPIRSMAQRFVSAARSMENATTSLNKKFREFGKGVSDFGGSFSLKVSAPIAAIGTMAVRSSAQFEKLKASLKTVTGSKEAADAAFKSVLDFASTTPFQLEEALGSFVKLKALGLDPSIASLRSYGNTASAMGKSLDQYIEAVADASTGEFERLKEFGIKASQQGNKVSFVFQGKKTVVKKNAEEIQKYLKGIGDVQFAGAMEEQMKTLSGAFSNLEDSVSTSLATVGDEIVSSLDLKSFTSQLADQIKGLAEAFKALPSGLQNFIIKGGLIVALLGPLIIGLGQAIIAFGGLIFILGKLAPTFLLLGSAIARFGVMLLTTPIGWFLLAIGALAAAAFLIIRNWEAVSGFFGRLWDDIKWSFQAGVDYVLNLLSPLLNAIEKVKNGYNAVRNFANSNPLGRAGFTLVHGNPLPLDSQQQSGPLPLGAGKQQVDAGGTLNIKIDGPPGTSVQKASMNDKRMDMNVDTGGIMQGAS